MLVVGLENDEVHAEALAFPSLARKRVKRQWRAAVAGKGFSKVVPLLLDTPLNRSCLEYLIEQATALAVEDRPQYLVLRELSLEDEEDLVEAVPQNRTRAAFQEFLGLLMDTLVSISFTALESPVLESVLESMSARQAPILRRTESSLTLSFESMNLDRISTEYPPATVRRALGSVHHLHFRKCYFDAASATCLFQEESLSHLETLKFTECVGDEATFRALARSLTVCSTRESSSLKDHLPVVSHQLKELTLDSGNLSDTHFQCFVDNSSSFHCWVPHLQVLDLATNELSHRSLPSITELLLHCPCLQRLILRENRTLFSGHLELTQNFAFALQSTAHHLEYMDLRRCGILDGGMGPIFTALEKMDAMEELDVRGNMFQSWEWTDSLPRLRGLTRLSLPWNFRSTHSPWRRPLVRSMEQNTSLRKLRGSGRWSRPGIQIANILQRNECLHNAWDHPPSSLVQDDTVCPSLWAFAIAQLGSSPTGLCAVYEFLKLMEWSFVQSAEP